MTSNHHAPYVQGYTRATMAGTARSKTARRSKSLKASPSSDCRLKPACMKPELLVTVDQNAAVNAFLVLYTPPVTPWKLGGARSRQGNMLSKAKPMTGVKS